MTQTRPLALALAISADDGGGAAGALGAAVFAAVELPAVAAGVEAVLAAGAGVDAGAGVVVLDVVAFELVAPFAPVVVVEVELVAVVAPALFFFLDLVVVVEEVVPEAGVVVV